jgi:Glycosyl-transferase for dystroglycan
MTPTSKDSKGGAYSDFALRRRSHSKDDDSPVVSSRFNLSPSKHARTQSPTHGHLRRRNVKGRNLLSITIMAADLLILGYALRSLSFFISSRSSEASLSSTTTVQPVMLPEEEATLVVAEEVQVHVKEFQFALPNTPACDVLHPQDVAYTLALQLSDTRLWMLRQHCALWGETAPISVAIWTSMAKSEVLDNIKSLGCNLDYITLSMLSSEKQSLVDYPINQLRNLALSGVATSHALVLDVDMLPSIDLFDTLNIPGVREALSKDPKLAVVVPAFQTQDLKCGTSTKCLNRHLYWMPKDFEDLVIGLSSSKILPYDPTHFSRQGSTNYRKWMQQAHGELADIPCVSSNQYQPYLVVRLCNHLPPFQERFVGYGGNNMAWTMHLRRVGYRLQQVGGSFIAHFPHPSSMAKLEVENEQDVNEQGAVDLNDHVRVRTDRALKEFSQWLHLNVDEASRLDKCDDFQEDDVFLWAKEDA